MAHSLPALSYDPAALEPHVDAETMRIHHGKHHAAYVNNLNAALEAHPQLQKLTAEQLISDMNAVPEPVRAAVRNNGGGHVNHSMFWEIMAPQAGGAPTGPLGAEIEKTFGSFAKFQEDFAKAAMGRFGSGWAWLIVDKGRKLAIASTPNQDNPMMEGNRPVFGLDVWEHAYYLKYQNRRADYVAAWWNVVNWSKVSERYAAIKS